MENDVKFYGFPSNDLSLHKKRIEEIEKIIDALLDIRLTLSVEKLSSHSLKDLNYKVFYQV